MDVATLPATPCAFEKNPWELSDLIGRTRYLLRFWEYFLLHPRLFSLAVQLRLNRDELWFNALPPDKARRNSRSSGISFMFDERHELEFRASLDVERFIGGGASACGRVMRVTLQGSIT
ncbi:hypothetical protein QTH97_17010 [Variovorax sp. J22R24]|uniref:hypothetical protein n=1 Tax=Variovorax gracilis TaxID=3053502 RepID=UPI0025776AFF|nr:hypothetical protein [Variovorax sp. J22R24]MDM0106649.1 hypothetical protein [Variovorax sp. J22R24]